MLDAGDNHQFVATNEYSLKQASHSLIWKTKAVYSGDTMVGFVMYKFDYMKRDIYLCRFMIDKKYQGQGFGVETLNELKRIARSKKIINKIELSTSPNNENGIRIYKKYGFLDMNKMSHGEKVFDLAIKDKRKKKV